jgi:DNA-binding CsgD family transcriptional regulator
VAILQSHHFHGPTPADHKLWDFGLKLSAATTDWQQLGGAWRALAQFFDARSVRLLEHLQAPSDEFAVGSVHVIDRGVEHASLARVLADAGADHALLAVVRQETGQFDALVVLRNGTAFGQGERAWMELLLPQIRFALALTEQLASPMPTTPVAAHLARLLPMPCLLTDEAGRCIERNEAFDRVLEALSGSVRSGRVVFDDPFLRDSWQQALVEGHATATARSLLVHGSTGSPWKVHIAPFACINSHSDPTPRHLMFASFEKAAGAATHTKTVPASRPLTKAELEVLANLLLGHTAKVIARARGASVNTVRSQITSILGKTGHRTQKELIASFSTSSFESVTSG